KLCFEHQDADPRAVQPLPAMRDARFICVHAPQLSQPAAREQSWPVSAALPQGMHAVEQAAAMLSLAPGTLPNRNSASINTVSGSSRKSAAAPVDRFAGSSVKYAQA